jgi:hypothetical protein
MTIVRNRVPIVACIVVAACDLHACPRSLKDLVCEFKVVHCLECGRSMKTCDFTGGNLGWKCLSGHELHLRKAMSDDGQSSCCTSFKCFCRGYSDEETTLCTECNEATSARDVYRRFVRTVSFVQEQDNNTLCVGGSNVSCEVDEIALRCVASTQDGQEGVWWLRWVGLTRRKRSNICSAPLPDRLVKNTGTGGGESLATA